MADFDTIFKSIGSILTIANVVTGVLVFLGTTIYAIVVDILENKRIKKRKNESRKVK